MTTPVAHKWKFYRIGGLDQVSLTTAADLLNLESLDPKLWVALSCPVQGLELDERTLALIDSDGDKRIRIPELLAAIKWAAAYLRDPADLLRGDPALPLAAITDATPEGRVLLASARQILASLGKSGATALTVADSSNTTAIFSASALNGDGILPPEAASDAKVQALLRDILACAGGTADRNGSAGVSGAQIDAFFADLAAYAAWAGQAEAAQVGGLGARSAEGFAALAAVRAKIDDFFARCRLAAFDPKAVAELNCQNADFTALAGKSLQTGVTEAAALPLARIEPGRALPLAAGVNPAWSAALARFQSDTLAALLGRVPAELTETEWTSLQAKFAGYEAWLRAKAGASVEPLGLPRVQEILAGSGRTDLADLLAQDRALEPQFQSLNDVDRLVRYHRDMRTLLHNFVNFADFYSRDRWAVFQAGTLYLDSRSTELCLRVDAPNALAAMSKAFIVYCTCTRQGSAPLTVAACFTQGESDYLFTGRHGVFYDRQGRDWDAVVTGIVDNPISIRQAFWSPYTKFLRMIEEQVAKRAASAEAANSGKLAGAAETAAAADRVRAEPKKFDLALITGIGVALGSIGTFAATLFTKFVDIPLWQYPLIVLGLMLLISLPSMVIAALKLRQRTLGPILEGNGWAVNGRVLINIPLGRTLTDLAVKPAGSTLTLEDPYEDKAGARRNRLIWTAVVVIALAIAAAAIRYDRVKHSHYFWQPVPIVVTPAAPAAK